MGGLGVAPEGPNWGLGGSYPSPEGGQRSRRTA
jgi:hypothetical protein